MTVPVIPGSVGNFYIHLLNGHHMCVEADLGSLCNRTPKSHTPKLVTVARPVHEVFDMLAHMEQRAGVNFFPLVVKCYRLDKFLSTKFVPILCQYKTVNSQAAVLQLCSSSFVLFHSIGFLFIYLLFVK